jgi:DNA invertase Pin-like site-specific DNA recombinase
MLCHKCDNPMCVNPSHLFVGTQVDNMRDAVAKGRPVGRPSKRHPLASRMIAMRKSGSSMYGIAKSLGLDHSTIRWHLSKET